MGHQVDQPITALLVDLKQRGLLNQTIVIFAEIWPNPPFSQGSNGRDHNPFGFSLWVAGGGFKGGSVLEPPMNWATVPRKTRVTSMIFGA